MKVIEKAITPCGVKIQIEDWKENYSSTTRDNMGERKRVNVSYDNGN